MRLTVNGRDHEIAPAPGERLLTLLNDRLHLPGTKFGCGHGECGACTVLLNNRLAYSCIVLAEACDSATVTTIEGLASAGKLAPLQRAFIAHDAAQCGYCTPGQLVAATHLLARNAAPDEAEIREAMSGNLCRCGTYPKIVTAIAAASRGDFKNMSSETDE
ncbi:MAG: (2Fe-2S)-binding protein [Gemmatimonadetes bacterium]|nr:(2Fe-2S)-binding protein [Gemmatimonadota bacterium]